MWELGSVLNFLEESSDESESAPIRVVDFPPLGRVRSYGRSLLKKSQPECMPCDHGACAGKRIVLRTKCRVDGCGHSGCANCWMVIQGENSCCKCCKRRLRRGGEMVEDERKGIDSITH